VWGRQYTGQRWEAGIGLYDYNARYYDPVLGRFVQADTVVPSMAHSQDFNRYSYVSNNSLRFIDPSGHFSEEQLNWLGYYSEDVSTEIWKLLLSLQPDDELSMSDIQGQYRRGFLGIAYRKKDLSIGLFMFGESDPVELLQWLGDDLSTLSVRRNTPDGDQLVWSAGDRVGLWASPIKQGGYVQTEKGAASGRKFQTLATFGLNRVFDLLADGAGFLVDQLEEILTLSVDLTLENSLDPGHVPDDVHMTFTYYDAVNDVYYARSMWLRPAFFEASLRTISSTWFENLQGSSEWNASQ
jgi:RHS repeat-associated protein